jgi:hypothetical protein
MNRTWNLSGWSLAYFGVILLGRWGRMNDEPRDGRSVPDSDKTL